MAPSRSHPIISHLYQCSHLLAITPCAHQRACLHACVRSLLSSTEEPPHSEQKSKFSPWPLRPCIIIASAQLSPPTAPLACCVQPYDIAVPQTQTHGPDSGPMHWLFPLPRMLFPQVSACVNLSSSCKSLLRRYFLREASPDYPFQVAPLFPSHSFPWYCVLPHFII